MVYAYRDHNAAWTCVDGDGLDIQVLLTLNGLWVNKIILDTCTQLLQVYISTNIAMQHQNTCYLTCVSNRGTSVS